MTRLRPAALAAAIVTFCSPPAAAGDWPMFGHDPQRSGVDAGDTILNPNNVGGLRVRWQIALDAPADSTPIYLESVVFAHARRAMLYQTDEYGTTYGIEADTGRILWRHATRQPNQPRITQSTPVADPSGTAIYAGGVDGFVRKFDATTGRELHAPGFPARITLMPETEKDASGLNLANGYLYVNTSGFVGDRPPYVGHVVTVRLSDGATHVFNSLCSEIHSLQTANSCRSTRSGIWSRGGVVVDPDPGKRGDVYVATGNGNFDANAGGHDYGDSILSLDAAGSRLAGYYTPPDYLHSEDHDADLGSTSPALLPRVSASKTPLMLVQGGKDMLLRLVNRDPLPGVAGELQVVPLPEHLFASPAVWVGPSGTIWVFLGLKNQVQAYRLTTGVSGASTLAGVWKADPGGSNGEGTSAVVSNGVVFVAVNGAVVALKADSGRILWSSAQLGRAKAFGLVHWESPIVAGGRVYCSDNQHLTAYALP